jgi:hypothetical protein
LFHIQQTGLVQEYIDHFTELVDQLIAYDQSPFDHHYYTMRFVDGLKDGIKALVPVERPIDLDTAIVLPLLQEEADSSRRREYRKSEFLFKPKQGDGAVPLPLPPLPMKPDKQLGAATMPDCCNCAPPPQAPADGKARGMCQFCAGK